MAPGIKDFSQGVQRESSRGDGNPWGNEGAFFGVKAFVLRSIVVASLFGALHAFCMSEVLLESWVGPLYMAWAVVCGLVLAESLRGAPWSGASAASRRVRRVSFVALGGSLMMGLPQLWADGCLQWLGLGPASGDGRGLRLMLGLGVACVGAGVLAGLLIGGFERTRQETEQ